MLIFKPCIWVTFVNYVQPGVSALVLSTTPRVGGLRHKLSISHNLWRFDKGFHSMTSCRLRKEWWSLAPMQCICYTRRLCAIRISICRVYHGVMG